MDKQQQQDTNVNKGETKTRKKSESQMGFEPMEGRGFKSHLGLGFFPSLRFSLIHIYIFPYLHAILLVS